MNYKLSVVLILIALIAGVLLSGCIENQVAPNQTKMSDTELINNYCQSQGFDRGITEAQQPNAFYEYWRDHNTEDGGFGYDAFDRRIICIKIESKESSRAFDYNGLYKWIKHI